MFFSFSLQTLAEMFNQNYNRMRPKYEIGNKVYYSRPSYGTHFIIDIIQGEEGLEFLLELADSGERFWCQEHWLRPYYEIK